MGEMVGPEFVLKIHVYVTNLLYFATKFGTSPEIFPTKIQLAILISPVMAVYVVCLFFVGATSLTTEAVLNVYKLRNILTCETIK